MCFAPPARTRSSPAMGHPCVLLSYLDMHNSACFDSGLVLKRRNTAFCFMFGPPARAAIGVLRSLSPRALVRIQDASHEIRDRIERCLRRVTMRRMSGARHDRHLDRAVAFLLRDLDLADGPVLVVGALQDRNRHPDVGEIFRNIPLAKVWIEPGVAPAIEGVVDIAVP